MEMVCEKALRRALFWFRMACSAGSRGCSVVARGGRLGGT